ncbi:sugar dehydrogenase [Actibacterium mucosum KCTC 23349]|uniref:Sugar dehydrogenase n=1 Tax=Actibacterium mucosum KCTC 23349 TaxID=1454373 RepID=A0A037ZHW5_9RHOB|nr:SDR family oxidoreductase [Actibacterium mucosum]KAJ55718.1 sugar dehydrogenase [Actibacterium mucosum KCTC 23349]
MRKTLLITGASTGIGAETARLAARDGWDVALNYRGNTEAAEGVAAELRALGAKAGLLQADMGDPAQVEAMFAAFDARFERLDGFVNNAGVVDTAQRLDEMSAERLQRMFAINTIGALLAAGQAVKRMSTRYGHAGGVIVNVSSAAARLGSGNMYVDYAASKGAIDTMTRGLGDEVAREGIRVVGIRPGLIETPIHAKGGAPNRAEKLSSTVPMGRTGTPDEVAEAIVWLLSDAASYMTACTIDVTGGR